MVYWFRGVLIEMAAALVSCQVGLDLKYIGAPDSVILAGMMGSALGTLYMLCRWERKREQEEERRSA